MEESICHKRREELLVLNSGSRKSNKLFLFVKTFAFFYIPSSSSLTGNNVKTEVAASRFHDRPITEHYRIEVTHLATDADPSGRTIILAVYHPVSDQRTLDLISKSKFHF